MTSGAAGTILCSLSSGLIMSATDGLLGLAGWRWLFLLQDRWMDGWMDGWMGGWMDGWVDRWIGG